MQIKYISHGLHETGGYRHEKIFGEALANALLNCPDCVDEIRFRKNYKGVFAWINLFFRAFFAAKADVFITVARLIWPVYLRNLFNNKPIFLVLHNFDENDGKPKFYYTLLKMFLRIAQRRKQKSAIIVVANFWKNYIENELKFKGKIFLYPNLFDVNKYIHYRDNTAKNPQLVHLGQWSDKIDKKAYLNLIQLLNEAHFVPYFSDNTGQIIDDFPVRYFETSEAYLKQMAMAKCTIVLNKVQEGWPRLVHESMLVGTPVISTGGGGVDELVKLGNGLIIRDINAIAECLKTEALPAIDFKNIETFDLNAGALFVKPMVDWMQ
jgi:glycosyltransferase involved in cell wall biosynthesis